MSVREWGSRSSLLWAFERKRTGAVRPMVAKGRKKDPPGHEVDLHGLAPDQALRRLAQEIHSVRVRGERRLRVITGRGWGNREQKPILRERVEAWLRGPEGRRAGVTGFTVEAKGGALDVEFG